MTNLYSSPRPLNVNLSALFKRRIGYAFFTLIFLFAAKGAFAQTAPCSADFVLDYNPVGNIDASRTDSTKALGIPEDDDTFNFVTLGFGGDLTLGFNPPAANGPGNDLQIYETSFGAQTCQKYPETARIWATADLVSWVDLGTVCLDGQVDFGALPWVLAVKIVDETPVPSPSRDGYDVDGVVCLNGRTNVCVPQCEPDSVWAFSQGTRKDGNAVDANRSIPGRATGTPEDDDTYNFFTLGTGGSITLYYSQGCLFDQQGVDFRVVETSFGSPTCRRYPESAKIEVSADGGTYYVVDPEMCLDGMVDFSSTGLPFIKYVRITDVSKLFGGDAMDYYDVDGIECVNQSNNPLRVSPNVPSDGVYIEDEYMQMYPNPAENSSSVTIRVESIDANPVRVDIFNTMGALIYSAEGTALVHEQIDLSGYQPGIYIVKMDVDGVVRTKKLIVQ